ncbi:hypothetical protein BO85DRAFT_161660 [Aspergillus piperis CBS 112811]|uniref:Uncharacterized protein n=1 Tax=Aspergillus piperis CBS 112811 TaxID=1448313 RepID=A0A8G1QW40_9EURO|nr:hypothetical protein BO85DRAFT_161660 [Aspergillus piperis CBS 112811]RAH53265.1 hypothetical protein BO85DRAFT_161660 [Aspergillus piperis CBS 112811]
MRWADALKRRLRYHVIKFRIIFNYIFLLLCKNGLVVPIILTTVANDASLSSTWYFYLVWFSAAISLLCLAPNLTYALLNIYLHPPVTVRASRGLRWIFPLASSCMGDHPTVKKRRQTIIRISLFGGTIRMIDLID